MIALHAGQRWEFVNATMGTVTEYELLDVPPSKAPARLRNVETDGIAEVWTLREGDQGNGLSHWRPKEEEAA